MTAPLTGLALVLFSLAIGVALGRLTTMKGWRNIWTHECGHTTDFSLYTHDVCPSCGVRNKNWTKRVGRDRFPFGYEFKEPGELS